MGHFVRQAMESGNKGPVRIESQGGTKEIKSAMELRGWLTRFGLICHVNTAIGEGAVTPRHLVYVKELLLAFVKLSCDLLEKDPGNSS